MGLLLLVALGWLVFSLMRSPYLTRQGEILQQPVPFSHDHHVAEIGIDCRYCHTAVEKSATAGIPPTATCMNCHNQIWAQAPMLEPVRASFRDNKSLEWSKLNDLPDFVYFNHSIHVAKGVACVTCHGPVNRMPLMYQWATLQMEWCLACHRDPVRNLRPREEVTNVFWQPPADLPELQQKLAALYSVKSKTSCSTCHR
ncbi:MAG: cytochrome c3 family protein [Thermoanaerobaculia bacterium]